MSIKKYETLLKTVDSGSLTRASEELGYTQSAISQMIKALEDELGLRLLIRDRAGVRLTEMGEKLLPSIREVCKANDAVARLARELQGLERGCVRIGLPNGLLTTPLATIFRDFGADEPDLCFSLRQGSLRDLVKWLDAAELDAIIMPLRVKSRGLSRLDLACEPLLAFFPQGKHLAEATFPLAALRDACLILPEGQPGETLRAALLERDAAPRTSCYAQDDTAALAMVQAGLGMALLPESLGTVAGVITRPTEPAIARQLFFYYREEQAHANATRRLIRWLGLRLQSLNPLSP